MPGVVTVLVGRSNTFGGEIIRMFDNGVSHRWSHGAIVLPSMVYVVDSRAFHGVQQRALDDFAQGYPVFNALDFEVPDPETGYAWLDQQVGKGYDYLAILGRLARRGWQEDSRWHCWELVEAFLSACGLQRWRDEPQRITPNMGWSNLYGAKKN